MVYGDKNYLRVILKYSLLCGPLWCGKESEKYSRVQSMHNLVNSHIS